MNIENLTEVEKEFIENVIAASFVQGGLKWKFTEETNEIYCTIESGVISIKFNPLADTYCELFLHKNDTAGKIIDSVTISVEFSEKYFIKFLQIFKIVKKEYKEKTTYPIITSMNAALDRMIQTEHTMRFHHHPDPTPE